MSSWRVRYPGYRTEVMGGGTGVAGARAVETCTWHSTRTTTRSTCRSRLRGQGGSGPALWTPACQRPGTSQRAPSRRLRAPTASMATPPLSSPLQLCSLQLRSEKIVLHRLKSFGTFKSFEIPPLQHHDRGGLAVPPSATGEPAVCFWREHCNVAVGLAC